MGVERNIEVHIENLVLHGFEAGPSGDIGRAVQGELTRLLGEKGIVPASPGAHLTRLDGGSFERIPGAAPHEVGVRIARAVHGGLIR